MVLSRQNRVTVNASLGYDASVVIQFSASVMELEGPHRKLRGLNLTTTER